LNAADGTRVARRVGAALVIVQTVLLKLTLQPAEPTPLLPPLFIDLKERPLHFD